MLRMQPPRPAFSRRALGSGCFLLSLGILGIPQKQQGFGFLQQCAPDTAQGTEYTALTEPSPSVVKLTV